MDLSVGECLLIPTMSARWLRGVRQGGRSRKCPRRPAASVAWKKFITYCAQEAQEAADQQASRKLARQPDSTADADSAAAAAADAA